jgi:serine/threonine-protein kinase
MAVPAYARHFGKYQLAARLATGGMAEIFLARLRGLAGFERFVVIKRILPHLDEDENFKSMFIDEARIAARISHPNVCQVYELGEVAGQYYLAMEYLEGVTLNQAMRKLSRERLTPDARLIGGLLMQACEGLHNAHELKDPVRGPLNIVHRDVTPHNLFVTVDGLLKVLDFGIAKAQGASSRTRTGTVKGKYAYMPPEQLRGEALDKRTDVWALGVVLFEALTGKRLFWRDTDFLIFRAITDEPIPRVRDFRPDVPLELDAAVATALSRKKDARFASARIFGEAVSAALAPLGGPLSQSAISAEVAKLFGDEIESHRALVTAALRECDAEAVVSDGGDPPTGQLAPMGSSRMRAPQAELTSAESPVAGRKPGTQPRPVLPLPPPAEQSQISLPRSPAPIMMGQSGEGFDLGLAVDTTEPDTATGLPGLAAAAPPESGRRKRKTLLVAAVLLAAGGTIAGLALRRRAPEAATRTHEGLTPPVLTGQLVPLAQPEDAGPPPIPDAGSKTETETMTVTIDAAPPPPVDAGPVPRVKTPGVKGPSSPRPPRPPRTPQSHAEPVPAGPPGFVSMNSNPNATNYVDGKNVGDTPLAKLELKPGVHRVKAVSAKGTKEFQVRIESGKVVRYPIRWPD